MVKKELDKILKDHIKWHNNEGGQRADLQDANLQRAYLKGANLQRAYLQGAYLQDANLRGANLQGANLQRAYLQGVYLRGTDLRGADLQGANLQGADLQGADLQGAYLQCDNLQGANLQRAYLQGAYLRGADLRGSDLQRADLRGAYLQGAYLRGADLRGSKIGFQQAKKFLSNKTLMNKMFKSTKKYWICYKSFNENYAPPNKWSIEKGKNIRNRIDDNRSELCSYGINVATLEWCKSNCNKEIWLVHIPKEAEVCVPYFTDGEVRVSDAKLVKVVE